MSRHTLIGFLVGIALTGDLLCAEVQDEPTDLSYLNGYTAGRALSGYYEGDEKAEFIRGLLEGINESGERSIGEGRMRDAKLAWFDATSRKSQASYAAGYLSGDAHKAPESVYSAYEFLQGLMDSLQNPGVGYVDKEQGTSLVTGYQRSEFYKLKRQVADTIKANERAGKAFLEANALRPGVVSTESGLQFRIIRDGDGVSPGAEDTVVVSLLGRKINGEVFYDSELHNDGKPSSIKVSQTLNGWQEALVQMSPGAEWELFLPAGLAYGNAGWQRSVEPGETLIYRVKLIDVIPANSEAAPRKETAGREASDS